MVGRTVAQIYLAARQSSVACDKIDGFVEGLKAAVGAAAAKWCFVRTPDLPAKNFECPLLSPRALDLVCQRLFPELGIDILTVPHTMFRDFADVAILDVFTQGRSISITV